MQSVKWLISIGIVLIAATETSLGADWPMRGRNNNRNAVVPAEVGPLDWQVPGRDAGSRNVRWSAALGSLSHGDPVVSGGLVWVGTNNRHPRDPLQKQDAGVLMCFDERDGKFLYQYLSPRLPGGYKVDWPMSSQGGSPLIEKDRLWFCNTRHEVICLDIAPLQSRTGDPTVVWKVDMREQLGVVPRPVMLGSNVSQCSIASHRNWIYINTTNGVPAPNAPSLICLDKQTGQVKWQDNSPGNNLIEVQHGSPLMAEIQGRAQVIMGQGDGWMRGFDALTGEVLWKFDINPKSAKRKGIRRRYEWNDLVAMPVFHEGRIYFAIGKHYEATGGPGRVCCVDPTKTGNISSELDDGDGQSRPNPNSGLVWEYEGGTKGEDEMRQTLSSVAIHQGLLFVPDTNGLFHCVDAATGKGIWIHDLLGNTFCSPLIVGNKVYMAAESTLFVFEVSREKQVLAQSETIHSMEASPVYANGVLFLTTHQQLLAIRE